MGAEWFSEVGAGNTAQEAFDLLTEEARYEYGHNGYTGTIADKFKFVMIKRKPMTFEKAEEWVDKQAWERTTSKKFEKLFDKWGPCGCIPLTDGRFYFFGNSPK